VRALATASARAKEIGIVVLIPAALACETREDSQANAVPSARPAAGVVVLAGRPQRARLPPRVAELAEPTLLLIPQHANEKQTPIGTSRMGGLPDLPADVVWPSPLGRPLTFVAQIDLAHVMGQLPDSPLPRSGMLYFFYDTEKHPWGYSPVEQDGLRVMYRTESKGVLRRRKAPAGLKATYGVQPLNLRSEKSYPDSFSPVVDRLQLGERESEEYQGFLEGLPQGPPGHRLLGHPRALGDDPMTDCHLVANGIDLWDDAFDQTDPRVKLLSTGSGAWRLLLELDTRASGEESWGDWKMAYFFIRRSDLEQRNFDSVCMVAQGD
jgi:hypothetical protein